MEAFVKDNEPDSNGNPIRSAVVQPCTATLLFPPVAAEAEMITTNTDTRLRWTDPTIHRRHTPQAATVAKPTRLFYKLQSRSIVPLRGVGPIDQSVVVNPSRTQQLPADRCTRQVSPLSNHTPVLLLLSVLDSVIVCITTNNKELASFESFPPTRGYHSFS
jgi:hypothetical protein